MRRFLSLEPFLSFLCWWSFPISRGAVVDTDVDASHVRCIHISSKNPRVLKVWYSQYPLVLVERIILFYPFEAIDRTSLAVVASDRLQPVCLRIRCLYMFIINFCWYKLYVFIYGYTVLHAFCLIGTYLYISQCSDSCTVFSGSHAPLQGMVLLGWTTRPKFTESFR